jgi:hypothetical protein
MGNPDYDERAEEATPERGNPAPPIPDTGRAIDHRVLAAMVTRFAIDQFHQAVQLREAAQRLTAAALAQLDDGEAGKRTLRQSVAFARALRWELWQDLSVWAETDAERQVIQAVRTWDESYDNSTDMRNEPTGWPPRGVISDGKFYLAVPAEDEGSSDRLLILDPAAAMVDVAAAVALGGRTTGTPESLLADEVRRAVAHYLEARRHQEEVERRCTAVLGPGERQDPEALRWRKGWEVAARAARHAEEALVLAIVATDPALLRVGDLFGLGYDWPERSVIIDGREYKVVPTEDRDGAELIVSDVAASA